MNPEGIKINLTSSIKLLQATTAKSANATLSVISLTDHYKTTGICLPAVRAAKAGNHPCAKRSTTALFHCQDESLFCYRVF